jgi:DNA-binding response OmpR family regulator
VKKRILVVDDERDIVDLLKYNLVKDGYEVLTAYNGKEALEKAAHPPDLVILDVMMPVLDGFETCKKLKSDPRTSAVPVLFLTASSSEVDEVLGLELGADDYMTKPFSPRELVARIRAILRRVDRQDEPSDRIEAGGVTIDLARMRVEADGRSVELTPTEFQLLVALARQPGRIFTRSQLLDAIHGLAFESYERAIDAHVKNLRRKLEPDPSRPRYVLTVYGVGYRFNEDAE